MGPLTISDTIMRLTHARDRRSFRVNLKNGSSFVIDACCRGWQYMANVGDDAAPAATAVGGWARRVRVHSELTDPSKIHVQLYDMVDGDIRVRMSVCMRPEDVLSIEPLGVSA